MQLVYEKAWKYKENGYKLASVICRQFHMIAEILLPWQFFELDFMLRNHENLPCNPTHLTHKRKIPGTYRQISSLVCIIMQENIISFVQFSADIIIPKYFRIEKMVRLD